MGSLQDALFGRFCRKSLFAMLTYVKYAALLNFTFPKTRLKNLIMQQTHNRIVAPGRTKERGMKRILLPQGINQNIAAV